ncbi:MAG: adenosylcobalamin-dependent ribonucleoside-diphosphate reductase [Thermoleophilia bacterium]|nr:adenosylcobalamin-dependent ribonucleoside-diphosphate reductase [Thermoleophilia bacterium]
MAEIKIKEIRARNGRLLAFDAGRIERAIARAVAAAGESDGEVSRELAQQVIDRLDQKYAGGTPTVEEIQDMVETVLMETGHAETARAYITYRRRHADLRAAKRFLGVKDDLKLPINSLTVLKKRYLVKDEKGEVVETPREMFNRVAGHIAAPDAAYGDDAAASEEAFFRIMASREFLPNSPTLMNAGTELGLLSACFVLPVPDSIPGIFDSIKYMAIIHQAGGGTGFSFSNLRPKGDIVGTTHGIASGPVSFMSAFDGATEVIKQGGRRRGANMGVLRADHPDILEFITAKQREDFLVNFNVSVAATDAFMRAVRDDGEFDLINPRNGEVTGSLKARPVMEAISSAAWRTGDPGMIFLDRINEANPTPQLGPMETTNPCGEQPLLPYESCNLGSIDLARLVKNSSMDWKRLGGLIDISVHFLDNVIDANRFPLAEITEMTNGNRKIGLGVMGFAEALIKLGIRYDSEEGLATGEKIMKFISERSIAKSREIARRRGSFPNFEGSLWQQRGLSEMRNSTVTTVAPTGTISVIAGTSSGIEPLFAISFVRDVMEGTRLLEVNPEFKRVAIERGFYSDDLMMRIAKTGSVQDVEQIPEDVRNLFRTAHDIMPEWHVRMQAAFQKHVDNAVSKTINLPREAGIDEVRKAYLLAYDLGCKGITVFRYGSKKQQVLYLTGDIMGNGAEAEHLRAAPEFAGGCPTIDCEF